MPNILMGDIFCFFRLINPNAKNTAKVIPMAIQEWRCVHASSESREIQIIIPQILWASELIRMSLLDEAEGEGAEDKNGDDGEDGDEDGDLDRDRREVTEVFLMENHLIR